MILPESFKSILWEYDLWKLNLDSPIVVQRVLNLWDKKITDFWIKNIWKSKAKSLFIKNSKFLDKKSYNYWRIIFGVKDDKISTKKTMYEKLNSAVFSRSFG